MASTSGVLSFVDWKPEFEAEKKARLSKAAKAPMIATAYSPESEIPPDAAWFRMDKEFIDSQIRNTADEILVAIQGARTEDKELAYLRKVTTGIKEVAVKNAKSVAIVGQQAMGKSLLINALLHRRTLSKTSAAGGACTASAIKYLYKRGSGDSDEVYDASIQFMDGMNLNEIAEEHVRRYYHFHHSGQVDEMYRDEEERAAVTAQQFFELVYNTHNDKVAAETLTRRMTAKEIEKGNLLLGSIHMAKKRIEESGADATGIKGFKDMHISDLMDRIQSFISQQENIPSLWPIVQYVQIFMGSKLLRNGVSIVDLPGLGDLNHSRTAATNSIRRTADYEIIVAKPERVTTEEVVDQQIKQAIRAHGANRTILVLTKIDEFFLDTHSIENVIDQHPTEPFPTIKSNLAFVDSALNDAEIRIEADNDEDADYTEIAEQVEALQFYQEYLVRTAQCAFIQQRATNLEEEMKYKYKEHDKDPIKVFSISASMYIDWMKKRQKERPLLTPEMTGIPKLRRFLLGLSAEDNLENYRHHVANRLPAFLNTIRRIIDQDKKDDAYSIIRPKFRHLVESLEVQSKAVFQDFLEKGLLRLWAVPSLKAKRTETVASIVQNWGEGTRWNTYNKFLRERGIVKKSMSTKYCGKGANWNSEISEDIAPDLIQWKRKMKQTVRLVAQNLNSLTCAISDEVFKVINDSTLSTPLKAVAVEEWYKRQEIVKTKSSTLELLLKNRIEEVYKYASTETDTRCMISILNSSIFEQIESKLHMPNFYKKQKEDMIEAMFPSHAIIKDVLDKISEHIYKYAVKGLATTFSDFTVELNKELIMFDEHISERLPPDYMMTDTDLEIRENLKMMFPQLERRVAELGRVFGGGPIIKRRELSVGLDDLDLESPTKKLKGYDGV
ncbi:hypothetical protein P154DRAFT_614772 [Amniculicola lignicola CBS 123094]|uniref:Dynamin N-terminal domain-containing protein n=1 Tax=Amniculicola lignicola CBS 123094 TaxID=1392246 RepID=A0A6A5X396_9PLEO|nr:hypothetical protein P154DRAFT_614772 [Amniculicola lignicola CBS 123094]